MEISLEGRVALVTGAGPNIGSGIALALARYGAKVACNDLDPEAARASVRRIERAGGTAMGVPGDVTREDEVVAYVGEILAAWGRIDILVNNASLLGGRGVLDESAESFTRAVLVAGLGNFLNTKHVARSMCERGIRGSIVCISSSNGWTASPGVIAYAFHKGGVNNFARAAAMDLAPYGIRVNTFTPTMVTPDNPELLGAGTGPRRGPVGGREGNEPWRRPARWSGERAPMVPMGATGSPTDIGHCIAWLCSDYARLITGCDFVADGGARARNFAHIPAAPEALMGPAPLIRLEEGD
jgi:NAD(P)-dependent dehydrogenase (short-subunit alcohol dehydrogenase family)